MSKKERKLVRNTDFFVEEMQDEVLLYKDGTHKAIYLNESAALVWKLCDGTKTVDDISEILSDNFPEPSVSRDVQQAVETLLQQGVLIFAE